MTLIIQKNDRNKYFHIFREKFRSRGYTGIESCDHVRIGKELYRINSSLSLPNNITEGTLRREDEK